MKARERSRPPDLVQAVRAEWEDGEAVERISERHGVSPSTIGVYANLYSWNRERRRSRKRTRRNPWVLKAKAMYEAGATLEEIAREMGRGASTIMTHRDNMGWDEGAHERALRMRRESHVSDGVATCVACGRVKPVSSFGLTREGGSVRTTCRACSKEKHRRRAGMRTREEIVALAEEKRYRRLRGPRSIILRDHPDATWIAEYRNTLFRARYEANAEHERARVKRYKHANPDKVAEWGDRRWQRIAQQTDGTVTAHEVQRLYAEFVRCPYCNATMDEGDKHLDHMDPVSRGGVHGLSNLVVCCGPCNLSKNDKPFLAWLEEVDERCRQRARRIYTQKQGCAPEQIKATALLYVA